MPIDDPGLDLRYLDGELLTTVSGREFYYEQRGQDGPHLTAVNNFFLIAPMWRGFTERLVKRNRILSYDLRNQGASAADVDTATTWDDHVADLAEILDALEIERTCLLSTSISSLICRDFALKHPDRVSGLIMVGPACTPGEGNRWRSVSRAWTNSLRSGGPEALWDHLYSMVFGEATMHRLGTAGYLGLREAFTALHSSDAALANLRSSLTAADEPSMLADLPCPVRLMVGEEDFLWSPSAMGRARELMSDVSTTWLPDVGHLPYIEDTEAFEAAVQDFLDDLAEREAGPLPRLRALVREITGSAAEPDDDRSLTELGVDSWGFVRLLTAVEKEFGLSWDMEVPPGALRSLSSLATLVTERAPR